MKSPRRIGAVGFLTVGLSALAAHGAVICVDPGSPPCLATVQAGVDAAAAGDTVEVAAGLYFEAVTIPAGKDGLILTGKGTIDPHDAPSDPNDLPPAAITVESANVTIDSLSIQNGRWFGIDAVANGLKVNKVTIRGSSSDCINVFADGAAISSNVLHGCGSEAIEIEGDNSVITKNKIANCDNDCVRVVGNGTMIAGNKVTLAEDGDCFDLTGDNVTFSKNNMLNCDNAGVRIWGDNATVTGNKMRFTDQGVSVEGDQPNVAKNKASGGESEGFRIFCHPCTGGTIAKNKTDLVTGGQEGFFIFADGTDPNDPNATPVPSGLIVEANSASTCGGSGFEVSGAGVVLRGNTAKKNGVADFERGFYIRGTAHTIEGNKAVRNFSNGFVLEGADHVLTGNTASDNLGNGIEIDEFSAGGHTLTGNKATKNLGQGFAFPTDPNDPPAANTLTGNTGSGNRTDYCSEIPFNVLVDNSFGTTAVECLVFD